MSDATAQQTTPQQQTQPAPAQATPQQDGQQDAQQPQAPPQTPEEVVVDPKCYRSSSHEAFTALIGDKYSYQEYTVKTEDGYTLTHLRLQTKLDTPDQKFDTQRYPIVLLHSFAGDSVVSFLSNSVPLRIPLILADHNYDVWLVNNRGARFCREHETLDPREAEFWNFTLDQQAEFDIPSSLKLVFDQTQKKPVVYGDGHGATLIIAALSDAKIRPKVLPYVHSVLGYSPEVFFNHPNRDFEDLFRRLILRILRRSKIHDDLGCDDWVTETANLEKNPTQEEIDENYNFVKDFNLHKDSYNHKRIYFYVDSLVMSGTSRVAYEHLYQLMSAEDKKQNIFRKFDHGSEEKNTEVYGTPKPPAYDLSLLQEKFTFWVGLADPFAYHEDMADLKKKAPNAQIETIYIENWGHDSGFAGPRGLLHDQLVEKIQQHLATE